MLEKKFQKNLHCGITVSMRILITSHTSETPGIFDEKMRLLSILGRMVFVLPFNFVFIIRYYNKIDE